MPDEVRASRARSPTNDNRDAQRRTVQLLRHLQCAAAADATHPPPLSSQPPIPVATAASDYLKRWKEAYKAYLAEHPEQHQMDAQASNAIAYFATTDVEVCSRRGLV